MTAANDNVKVDYDEPWSRAVLGAEATGREKAVNAIFDQAMAVRDRAYSGQATHETCKARGALHVWRAAYAAAYREMLAIEDELKTYAQGGGLMDTIPEHLEEVKRRIDGYADMKAACAKAAQAPYDDDELPF